MRIAVLPPADKEENRQSFEKIKKLVNALAELEFEPILFEQKTYRGDRSHLAELTEFFEKVGPCDLVHNFAGFEPMILAAARRAPIITTLLHHPDEEEKAALAKAGDLSILSALTAEAEVGISGLSTEVIQLDSDDAAAKFAELYKRIGTANKSEDCRPWGHYVILSDEKDHKVKRIVVKPGKRLSYQSHKRRAEHWYVIEGTARVTLNDKPVDLRAGEAIDIAAGDKHRVENPGDVDMAFIEVQTGDYFGEDDIVRYEDDYGRS